MMTMGGSFNVEDHTECHSKLTTNGNYVSSWEGDDEQFRIPTKR